MDSIGFHSRLSSTGAVTVMDMKVFGTKLYIGLSNGAGRRNMAHRWLKLGTR